VHIKITGGLRDRNATFLDQTHRLKLELAAELPSLHVKPPVPLNTLSRCPRNRQQAMSCNATAKQFSVAVSTVIKLMQARKATGSLAPKQMGGYRKAILAPHEGTLKALVAATPDATLAELGQSLRKKKIKVSRSALAAFLKRARLTFKKKPCTPPSKTAMTSPRRARRSSLIRLRCLHPSSCSSTRPASPATSCAAMAARQPASA
jgi:putative transposase